MKYAVVTRSGTSIRWILVAFAAAFFIAGLLAPARGDTLTMKCAFEGPLRQNITYIVNDAAQQVTIIGDFGTHIGVSIAGNATGYYFILEPNAGASVATIIYLEANDTPVAVRTTLGKVKETIFSGIPEDFRVRSDNNQFMVTSQHGRCPVQR